MGIFDSETLVVHLIPAMIKVLRTQLPFSEAEFCLFAVGLCLLWLKEMPVCSPSADPCSHHSRLD